MTEVVQLKLRLPPELHERIKQGAEFQGKSLNSLIVGVLERSGEPSKREAAALAILRQQALRDAVATAKPGESRWDMEGRADGLLAYMLGER